MNPQVPITPENTPPVTQPVVPEVSKDNHGVTILSMAVFVLLSLGAVAFLYYQNQQLKSMLASYKTPTPSPTSKGGNQWETKTYTSNTYGVSFDYPADLEVKEFKDFGISLWKTPAPSEIPLEAPFPPIHIMILPVKNDTEKMNAIKAWTGELNILRIVDAKIGHSDVKVTVGIIPPGPYYADDVIHYSYIEQKGKVYLIRLDATQYQNVAGFYQQILSTFRFTEVPSTSPTATSKPISY